MADFFAAFDLRIPGELHAERFYSTASGTPIHVVCECPIGIDHTYAEWVQIFQLPETPNNAAPDLIIDPHAQDYDTALAQLLATAH